MTSDVAAAKKFTIRHLPHSERPREKMIQNGPKSLSTVELLAILLGSGTRQTPVLQLAQELMAHFGTLENLAESSVAELRQIKGIGLAKAIQLKAAFGLSSKLVRPAIPEKIRIDHPEHAYHLLKDELIHEKRELFIIIMLDIRGYVICYDTVSIGTLTSTLVHPREVFYPAIRNKAASIILAHNHPSGDLSPSTQDLQLTKALKDAGQLIGIPVTDHLIIAHTGFLSFKQQKLI